MRSIRRVIPWVLPLLLTIVVVTVYLLTYDLLVLCPAPFTRCQVQHGITEAVTALLVLPRTDPLLLELATFRGRIIWTVAVGASILVGILAAVVSFAALLYSVKQIRRANVRTLEPDRKPIAHPALPSVLTVVFLAVPVVVPIAFYTTHHGNAGHPWRQLLSEPLMSTLPEAARWTPYLDMAGLAVAIMLAWAACALLKSARVQEDLQAHLAEGVSTQPLLMAGIFHEHATFLKSLLYTGAALLVVSVARVHTLLDWELGFLRPDAERGGLGTALFAALEGIVTTIITAQGLFYSLMLAALFVPAYLMLHTSGREALSRVAPTADREEQLQRWENHFNAPKLLPKLLAILAPLLSAPISQFLEGLLT